MTGFQFTIEGFDKLQQLTRKMPVQLRDELRAEVDITADEIAAGARRDAPKDEGILTKSISKKTKNGFERQIVAQSSYAGYQEFGTKTHVKVPSGLESVASQLRAQPSSSAANPLEALRGWVRRKGLAATYSTTRYSTATRSGVRTGRNKGEAQREKQIAFLIWRKIKKYGIKPQPFFFKQLEPARPLLIKRVSGVLKRVVNA